MLQSLRTVLNDAAPELRNKLIGIYAFLIFFNVAVWIAAYLAFRQTPLLLGTAFLAYGFGLRHAVDADHIAAIDNVTRKLMQDGKKPVAVGLMFSLGHSTVVILACLLLALSAMALKTHMEAFHEIGGIIGTLVSAFFLLLIAMLNLIVLRSVWRKFRDLRSGKPYVEEDVDLLLGNRGFMARIFRPMFKLITRSWHMYPLGFLFGLGFDTATEISLLGISATQTANGLPIWTILLFPLLFTAAMSLIDTTDGILMLGAYGWAFVKPVRKLYYNMTITFVSVLVAVLVGSIEVLGLMADKLELSGAFWDFIGRLSDSFGVIGYLIIGLFVAAWLLSLLIYKWRRYDELDLPPASDIR
ncbi:MULTISPECIES: HoxN/HupN/NixA family nickel/cobalt transporter [unclassified Herbaspirillum]|jgi:high-affinity nickel-transport protein|uniref:HoxN/HupN/NixA family nickel/cobalt transporter n=1 Tax=unclassified Herbaspirillum TaxID=2624150 RepID=UPI0015849E12|nr:MULTISPECIES: HoxN/HupN/NixA family nickel/cobalt transporter [unclassified Herbaspirillum]MCI1006077.1 HoxN/HupN/NixA family nickel/cobalt transporter [Herbaspirillum sp. C7C8]NUT60096.1 HoxN/HupN/NixA family nickel/cobalt transporter [Herbaspirillum sp. C9C3]